MSSMLWYNGVGFDHCHVQTLSEKPVMDEVAGVDRELTEVTLYVVGTVNEFWISTNKRVNPALRVGPRNALPQTRGVQGDRPGNFLANVRKLLTEPCGRLLYSIGDDTVLNVPETKEGAFVPLGAAAVRYSCDAKSGPFPFGVDVQEVVGAKSLFVRFGVKCYVNDRRATNILLSNRWTWSETVDDSSFSTVRISGMAAFRKDMLLDRSVTPDDFRYACIPRPGRTYRRGRCSVRVSPDGTKLAYDVDWHSVNYAFGGEKASIYKWEVNCTSGISGGNASVQGMVSNGIALGKGIASRDPISVISAGVALVGAVIPKETFSVTARCYGHKGADRRALYMAAVAMAFSRNKWYNDRIDDNTGRLPGHKVFAAESKAWMTGFRSSCDWSSEGMPMCEFSFDTASSDFPGAVGGVARSGVPPAMSMQSRINTANLKANLIGFADRFEQEAGFASLDGGNIAAGEAGSVLSFSTRSKNVRALQVGQAFVQALGRTGDVPSAPTVPPVEGAAGRLRAVQVDYEHPVNP